MTLSPTDSYDVRGVPGPTFKVGPTCSNPTCDRQADHGHHIWRASKVANHKQNIWVAIDGFVIGNLTGLCWKCHNDVTEQRAAIRWIQGTFWWCLVTSFDQQTGQHVYHPIGTLSYQPPTPDELTSRASDESSPGPDSCPFCGHETKRRPTPTRVGRRNRKTWTVVVPADDEEQGADVLDSLVESLAPLVPNADSTATGRYYVIVPALAFALLSSAEFVAAWQERQKEHTHT